MALPSGWGSLSFGLEHHARAGQRKGIGGTPSWLPSRRLLAFKDAGARLACDAHRLVLVWKVLQYKIEYVIVADDASAPEEFMRMILRHIRNMTAEFEDILAVMVPDDAGDVQLRMSEGQLI